MAGQGRDLFHYNPDEDIKWELRNVLYAQERFYELRGRYAKKIKDLKKVGFNMNALKFKPEMESTNKQFEAKTVSIDEKRVWFINNDGLVWDEINTEK
jgi:hypothetical protein